MLHNAIDLGPVVFRFEEYVFSIMHNAVLLDTDIT